MFKIYSVNSESLWCKPHVGTRLEDKLRRLRFQSTPSGRKSDFANS